MSARTGWIDGRVDVLLAALHDYGMSMSRPAAVVLINERVRWVAAQLGISPSSARRHLTDEALTGLSQEMVFQFADETPGADVAAAPRTAALPVAVLGRCVAALAECLQVRLAENGDVDHLRSTIGQLAHALSALGQVTAEVDADSAGGTGGVIIPMPPGLINRVARYAEAAASLAAAGVVPHGFDPAGAPGLANAFRADAAMLRIHAATGRQPAQGIQEGNGGE